MPLLFPSLQSFLVPLPPPPPPPPSVRHLRRDLSPPPQSQSLPATRLQSPQQCLSSSPRLRRRRRRLRVQSVDAAPPFDREPELPAGSESPGELKIAVIGFGNFGQFLAKTLARQGHAVLVYSRSDHSDAARKLGVTFFREADDLCEEHPDVILLCTSIISLEQVVKALPLQRLKRSTLVVDVLSVKEFAKSLLVRLLPPDFDIICTHPMFGPASGKNGWSGLNFVYEKVRIGDEESRILRAEKFLEIFVREGCNMLEMTCAEHDKSAAESQFITHTVGRVLEKLDLESTPINTKGYEKLLALVDNTAGDSFDLYHGLFMYNKNSLEMLDRLDLAFETLKQQLFGRLHDVVRKQLVESAKTEPISPENYKALMNITSGAAASKSKGFQDVAPSISYLVPSASNSQDRSPLKIAIVGFGNFGQFLAKTMVHQGHTVIAYSRSDYSEAAQRLGVSFFSNADDLCEEHPDVILLCSSILSTESVLKSLPLHRLKRNTLFVDVLSVKEFPRVLFLQNLPLDFDILCTHPMFGPESGKNGWNGLSFVYDKVRVGSDELRQARCDQFLGIFAQERCLMLEMSCAEHDWHAAGSQFITHTMGRTLEKLQLESTPINTKGYETLLNLVENTAGDSFDLYYGLFMYNVNAMEQLERLDLAFDSLKEQLFGRLHGVLRKQLFENADKHKVFREKPVLLKPSQDVAALLSSNRIQVQNL